MSDDAPTEDRRRSKVGLAMFLGAILGALWGVPRYGAFTFANVAVMGLGIIVTCAAYAIVIAIKPATDGGPDDRSA